MGEEIIFTIFTGAHAGAEARFPPGEYALGSSEECDLILRDSGIAGRHCSLLVREKGPLLLHPLEGTLLLEGTARSEPFELPPATPVLAGLVCFAWIREGESWGNMRLPSLLGEEKAPESAAPSAAAPAADGAAAPQPRPPAPAPKPPPPQAGRGRLRPLAAAVAVLLLLALSLNLIFPGEEGTQAERLAAELKEAGFPDLLVSENNSRVVIHGLVPTPADANKVRSIATRQSYPVQVMLRDREELARAVQSLLAGHGLFPRLRFDGTGAELAGYALDSLTARAALAWAREAAGSYADLRSALLTRGEVEETLRSALLRAGLDKKTSVDWQAGTIVLSGPGADDPALPEVILSVREALDSPIAFSRKTAPPASPQSKAPPAALQGKPKKETAEARPAAAEAPPPALPAAGPYAPGTFSPSFTPGSFTLDPLIPEPSIPGPFSPGLFAAEPLAESPLPAFQADPFGGSLSLRGVTPLQEDEGGSPSFITLSDGRVFFRGGVLPSGYVLVGIYPDRLEFSRNGSTLAYKLQGR
ncbi:MAG: type III secretion system inner membrane ring subunit SctD [Deltaproteobacteria bacterium]|jgi:type III secretion system YscD/HrpQ family protein|nr:type III secretion system inner membrane ring subunit SctD [Deltaproteobacteria bacterium]